MIDTAMLMAAGLGKRMRPLTATRPKPLVKVAGKALMDHALDRLAAGGIKTVVVNVHYLADTVEAHLKTRKDMDFRISDERAKLLETGGGLIHAKPLLGDKAFICANSDNLWIDGPAETLGMMQRLWDPERMDALLLLVPLARANCHSGPGDFHMDANGRLTRRKTAHVAPFVFTGVQVLSPRLLVDPPADVFSTNIFWNRAIEAGRLYGAVHQGLWFDVGTPQAIPVVESMIAHG
ncbi:nucleotidyltransferase family protein [Sphingobium yanoikuyae]|jgi:MurNAc alpha-1-phosphate uridylyltransferase|uniref:Nucleotidyltransferase family protein n=1 Tax=Sphingobium yanoikuyae TaxID=13690 RepID=A0A085KAL4_SPHYA|nr:nucleotidyltransferase family protein [Sphingobium yanoikuyae]AYO77354.1 nucleotidyltransferase family protein [Sphingobium yanoikuyae]KFD29760.1 mannose-1-phosphate guanylyltransferase [Sphingobium yanoikuyae]KZC82228.1 mannose-1-phosphate guanylyltransferase [Sphingobium yanoikuyae]MDV3481090.1 nucleotidyltransferase family protein [Sphingobium yanoikuyae]